MEVKIPISKPIIEQDEIDAVIEVLKSGMLTRGKNTELFEKEFASYIGTKYAVTVTNGTVALEAALKALGVGEGDEVIVPDFTFIATANAVVNVGGRPVFADIDERTYCIDPESVNEKITNRTRAIIPVHLFGHMADMNSINEIAIDNKLVVLEDSAQAHGAEMNGVKAGSIGHASAFSFYATKNMMTGEGGMVTTNLDAVYEFLVKWKKHGEAKRYLSDTLGTNLSMTEMQAAIGRVQLKKLDRFNEIRRQNAAYFTKELSKVKEIKTPVELPGYKHVYHQYVIRVPAEDRDKLIEHLNKLGIGTAIHYPYPLHIQPIYKAMGYPEKQNPVSLEVSKEVLSIPVHPLLSKSDLEYIVKGILSYFNQA
ncbi:MULTISPECIES: DegT/DnrJ/EryC1/StrS family aminotransferase [Fervidicoccus]|uniref:Aspartate aminotransferase n=2 Tax=Fervidicoccus fontis TaxID=683846 RepID=I0A2L7_FERFK|nr:DegT/DnrJ/EryC1/StrS family aminotransferase [Fervidicoccus fontis]AFH43224.1 aspartate aminotransferase [Fervidicoccus fontis Kam940]PMB75904.1 MAG: UDP-4-amino-4-deoxy-L-arabinose aminotransferase [Fervidicoccus fontis]PMB77393.1 MAG: UDP-4-amino-4-deoxy-L-arabinose aminotransferase [Fervidicoccus fontis]HEW63500.1 DegT/DnrJ/EryC1/StrS family aminotransferase [Fervidicoccus fontis]